MILTSGIDGQFKAILSKFKSKDIWYWDKCITKIGGKDLRCMNLRNKCRIPTIQNITLLITDRLPRYIPDSPIIIYCIGDNIEDIPDYYMGKNYAIIDKDLNIDSNSFITTVHRLRFKSIGELELYYLKTSIKYRYLLKPVNIDVEKSYIGECRICYDDKPLCSVSYDKYFVNIHKDAIMCSDCIRKLTNQICPFTKQTIVYYRELNDQKRSNITSFVTLAVIDELLTWYYAAIINDSKMLEEYYHSILNDIFNVDPIRELHNIVNMVKIIPHSPDIPNVYELIKKREYAIEESFKRSLFTIVNSWRVLKSKNPYIQYIKYHYTKDKFHEANIPDEPIDYRKDLTVSLNTFLKIPEDFLKPKRISKYFDTDYIRYPFFCCICGKRYIDQELIDSTDHIFDRKARLNAIHSSHIATHEEYLLIIKSEELYRCKFRMIEGANFISMKDTKKLNKIRWRPIKSIDLNLSVVEINKEIDNLII